MGIITNDGHALFAQKQGSGQALIIDRFVLAYIDGLDPDASVNPDEPMPSAGQIQLQQTVSRSGYVNPDKVVYSLYLPTTVPESGGEFTFNWIGLLAEDDTLVAVDYIPPQLKYATNGPAIGNSLTRNFLITYTDAQAITEINVDANTWQMVFDQATEIDNGMARIATQQEVDNGDDDQTFLTPAKLARTKLLPRTFETLAQCLSADNLEINQLVIVANREDENDGGGNTFRVVPEGTGVHDNGKYIDHPNSGVQLIGLFPKGEVLIQMYGAKPGASDNAIAIQAALSNHARVVVDGGLFKSSSLTVSSFCHLEIKPGSSLIPTSLTAPFLTLQSGAAGSKIVGRLDYSGTGETWSAIRSFADDSVFDVEIVGLEAPASMADSTCSGLQIRANNNKVERYSGKNFANTGSSNPALPHMISVEGNAENTEIDIATCKGGATGIVQSSGNGCHIGQLICEGLTDNGLYVLSSAEDTTCDFMYYEGLEEPVVHKGGVCIIDSLVIKNQKSAVGVDDNTGLLKIGSIELIVDAAGMAAQDVSSVVQSRNTNTSSAGVMIGRISGITFANRVFAFTNGEVDFVSIENNSLVKRHTTSNTEMIIYSHGQGSKVRLKDWDMLISDDTGTLTSSDVFEAVLPTSLSQYSEWSDVNIRVNGLHIFRGRNVIQDKIEIHNATLQEVGANLYVREVPSNRDGRKTLYGSSAPSVGNWLQGDRILDVTPSAGAPIGWVCVTDGSPGTWKSYGTIEA